MTVELHEGCIVIVKSESERGPGKLISVNGDSAAVEWFVSVVERQRQECPADDVRRWPTEDQTRCYVNDGISDVWRMGRIRGGTRGKDGRVKYEVHFPGDEADYVPEADVWVRCYGPSGDPLMVLIAQAHETPFFYEKRRAFTQSLVMQRAACHGLTALLSSRIELYQHQVEVVRRVLSDPVQRYLLADEVGLGKTIEAGTVLRQLMIDHPHARALVVAPLQLCAQWRRELRDKFMLDEEKNSLWVLPMSEVVLLPEDDAWDMVIVDEAHHLAATALDDCDASLWPGFARLCHQAPRLLLLSATPALNHERSFLAMLHLLEPQTYRMEHLPQFESQVRKRQPIGSVLRRLREGTARPFVRRLLSELRELFPADEWVLDRCSELDSLCQDDEYDEQKGDRVIRELRVHISETHRVYRRMLRTSRALVGDDVLPSRAGPGDQPPVSVEYGVDEVSHDVEMRVNEWREAAAGEVWMTPEDIVDKRRRELADVLAVIVVLLGTDSEILRAACEARLHGEDASAALPPEMLKTLTTPELFDGEHDLLENVLSELGQEAEDETQLGMLLECVKHYHSHGQHRIAVYSCYTHVAELIANRLRGELGSANIDCHLQGMTRDRLNDALASFRYSRGPAVLVCDRSGEEGINLQHVDRLVHFDLPTDPNRLEQRIGRVDRIGRSGEVLQTAFVRSEYEYSLHDAWFRMLRDGLQVFSQSIADLQFYVDRLIPDIRVTALLDGASGVIARLDQIREDASKERKALREQWELDELQAFEEDTDAIVSAVIASDSEWKTMQATFEDWAVDALHLTAWVPDTEAAEWDQHGLQLVSRGQKVCTYTAREKALTPAGWSRRIDAVQPGDGSFSRAIALQIPEVAVFRLGHPLLDLMGDLMRWDDRGQAAARWRYVQGLPEHVAGIYFGFDYIVEADISLAGELLVKQGIGQSAQAGLRRQADAWFPPRYESVWTKQDLRLVTDDAFQGPVTELLNLPYRKIQHADSATGDYNLNPGRIWALEDLVTSSKWGELCEDVHSLADREVRNSPAVVNACNTGSKRAQKALLQRMDQLRRGLAYGSQMWAEAGSAGGTAALTVDMEDALYQAVIEGIAAPAFKLDAVQAVVLSANNPFRENE